MSSSYYRKATPLKSPWHHYINKEWALTTATDTLGWMGDVSWGPNPYERGRIRLLGDKTPTYQVDIHKSIYIQVTPTQQVAFINLFIYMNVYI